MFQSMERRETHPKDVFEYKTIFKSSTNQQDVVNIHVGIYVTGGLKKLWLQCATKSLSWGCHVQNNIAIHKQTNKQINTEC